MRRNSFTTDNYFVATCATLDRLSSTDDDNSGHLLDALLTILSLFMDRVSNSVHETKYVYLSAILIQSLGEKLSVGVDGVIPALMFASRLLMVRDEVEWDELAQLYGLLISFIADDRPKVREQSQWCLREVLEHLQFVPGLVSQASEAITNVFERFILLAQGSNENVPEAAAQEALYIVDALNIFLPFMSSTQALDYFLSPLELRHPRVTTYPLF